MLRCRIICILRYSLFPTNSNRLSHAMFPGKILNILFRISALSWLQNSIFLSYSRANFLITGWLSVQTKSSPFLWLISQLLVWAVNPYSYRKKKNFQQTTMSTGEWRRSVLNTEDKIATWKEEDTWLVKKRNGKKSNVSITEGEQSSGIHCVEPLSESRANRNFFVKRVEMW